MRLLLALALLFACSQNTNAQCKDGVCPLQMKSGQPLRNAIKAPVIVAAKVAKAAVVLPAKVVKGVAQGTAHVFREVRPVRRLCRGAFRVVTFRGPILTRMRGHRHCH